MNRRSFLSDMLKAGVACTFLPGAGRIWKPTYAPVRYERCFVPDSHPTLDLNALIEGLYRLKRAREMRGEEDEFIYRVMTPPPLTPPLNLKAIGVWEQMHSK